VSAEQLQNTRRTNTDSTGEQLALAACRLLVDMMDMMDKMDMMDMMDKMDMVGTSRARRVDTLGKKEAAGCG